MRIRDVINPAYWVNKTIDKRIYNFTKGVGAEMKYDPLLVSMKNTYNDSHMTRRLLENGIWYAGIEQDLQYFYRTEAPKFVRNNQKSESLNYFWADTNNDFRRIHSGFPQLISEKMVDLIIGNGFELKVEGKNEEDLQEELNELMNDNKFNILMSKGIETESWSGGVAWKMSYNPLISEYPIIESWQPENYTNKILSGRVVEDIFYVYYEKGNTKYRLSEMYGVDKQGSYIDYKLEILTHSSHTKESKWIIASLSELEQTKDLKRISFNGYYKRLSLYKPNKLPNSEFRQSTLGESDYSGSYGAFDGIDEILSTWIQEYRDTKVIKYFPDEYVPKDASGQAQLPDDFKRTHIIYADSPSENVDKQKIIWEQGNLQTDKHMESYKIWVAQVLNNAGLSPLTVGITGLESIDASAESQQEREKVSIRTRNKKIELWKEFLQEFMQTALEFYLMTKGMTENEDGEFTVASIPEFDIIPTFEDYIVKSKADRTTEVAAGIGTGWDILTGVQYIHEDKTPKEQFAIAARIKLDNEINSISTSEAAALQDANMNSMEALNEDGVENIDVPVEPLNANSPVAEDNLE